jgi:hypothetical protein
LGCIRYLRYSFSLSFSFSYITLSLYLFLHLCTQFLSHSHSHSHSLPLTHVHTSTRIMHLLCFFLFCEDIGWVVGHSFIVYGPLLNGTTTVLYEGKPIGTPDVSLSLFFVTQIIYMYEHTCIY